MNSNKTFLDKLKEQVDGEVYNDKLHLNLYSTDASNYQIRPVAVLFPKSVSDVQKAVKCAFDFSVPIISRGGGSSLSGQSIGAGLIIDYSKYMNEILLLNTEKYEVQLQPGIPLSKVNKTLATKQQMIGPDPSSAKVATLGGMLGNNTTGTHSIIYGQMLDQVNSLEVVLADGTIVQCQKKTKEELEQLLSQNSKESEIYKQILDLLDDYKDEISNNYPKTWRNVAGYNLNRLLKEHQIDGSLNLTSLMVGSEGTLGTIVSASVKTVAIPVTTCLGLVHFSDIVKACEAVPALLKTEPTAIELSNDYFFQIVAENPTYNSIQREFIKGKPAIVLIVEYSANTVQELESKTAFMYNKLEEIDHTEEVVLRKTQKEIDDVWMMRKAGFGLIMSKRGDAKPLSFADDAAVPVENLSKFLPEIKELFEEEGIKATMVGHASAGCVHINPNINLKTKEGVVKMKKLSVQIAETAMKYDGTTSGEHGEGLARSYFNEQLYGKRLHMAFKEVKNIFDPKNIMQPGKILNASKPWDTNLLRYKPEYKTPLAPKGTVLDFSNDGGFSGLVEMCNGMGFCRSEDGGTMCPSYRATKDEQHSTRGRANALRAAIKGDLSEGLSDESLYNALDLCLECKACKTECPSLVDMAKLKYEYLHQYQKENGYALKSMVFGHVHTLNKMMRPIRGISNTVFKNKMFKHIMQSAIGVDVRRAFPSFAKENFLNWFHNRKEKSVSLEQKEIILWNDTYVTFNNPEIGKAAVNILEALDYKVILLEKRVCCGRPMISKGLLENAKSNAATNVSLLLPYAKKGIPIIGLEPSCIATFKDEYPDLLKSEGAKIVAKNSFFFEDFFMKLHSEDNFNVSLTSIPNIDTIKVHNHCYQKAIGKPQNTNDLLNLIPNTKIQEIKSGCCGMAGSFGYEKSHYEVSMKIGEETLFPAVRNASKNTLIAASGISCRHQIKDGTGVKSLHPLEIIEMALI